MLVLTRTEGIFPSFPVKLFIKSNSPTTTILITEMFSTSHGIPILPLIICLYFYFYTKENNRYKLEKIEREKVELEETNEVNPKIVYRKFEDVEDIIKTPTQIGELLGLKFEKETINLDTISNRFMGFYKGSRKSETVLYIPVGSIVENFNPNVE